jgi:hypothetical protein
VPFGKLQAGCHVPFTEEWFPSGHSTIKAGLVECCRVGCPSERFSHLHRGTLVLCQSDHWVLCHLRDQGPSPPIAQFDRAASSRKSLGCSKLLPFKVEATVFLGTFDAADIFLVPFPRSVARHNPVSKLYRQISSTSWLGFLL